MESVIICKSVHNGNTRKVAEAVSEVLGCEVKEPKEVEDIEEYDLVGFASGVYFGSFHRDILELVESTEVKDVSSFVLATSGMPPVPVVHGFESEMKEKLCGSGFDVVGSFNCRGYDEYGPLKYIGGIHTGRPNENDLKDAREFAMEVSENAG